MISDRKSHELMKFETVQRWMEATRHARPPYRVGLLDALANYCESSSTLRLLLSRPQNCDVLRRSIPCVPTKVS